MIMEDNLLMNRFRMNTLEKTIIKQKYLKPITILEIIDILYMDLEKKLNQQRQFNKNSI